MNNADGYVVIGTKLDTTDFDKSLSKLQSGLESKMDSMTSTITKKMNGMTNTVTKAFNSLKKTIIGLGIFSLIRRMFNFDDAVKRVDALNNFPRVMSNLGISAKDAEASMKRMSDALLGLPTTLDEATLSVQRFTSANGNVKASTEMFLALNNAILAGGASTQVQSTALEQLSQAYAKGKPDMMEWRTAMTAMPAQLKQVAIAMGYASSSDLGEALRSGTVSMNEFMATIVKLNKQGVNGFKSFDEQARNSTGGIATSLRNLKTTFTRAFADILNAVGQANIAEFFDKIKNAIIAVTPYIAGFVKAILMLFGINNKKQADDTAKSFNNLGVSVSNATDGLSDATGAAKSLNKELKGLSSFDEMNVLPDKSSTDSGGGASVSSGVGGGLGDLDFGDFETSLNDVADKTKEIADKILKFINPILVVFGTIGTLIEGFKLANLLKTLGLFGKLPLWQLVLGLSLILVGIVEIIVGVIEFIKDPSWDNFLTILQGIALVVAGIAILMGGWVVALIALGVALVTYVIKNWDKIKEILGKVGSWINDNIIKPVADFFKGLWQGIKDGVASAVDWVKTKFNQIVTFFANIISKIVGLFKTIGTKVGDAIGSAFKNVINGVLKAIENILNTPIRAINSLIGVINKVPGVNLGKLSTFNLPRLAKGGIINMPGQGIPVGSALAGERGREAVLPLTDTQQMQLLGEAIGRYITLNATIPVQIGNRQVAREIRRINTENDFVFNR